MLQRLMHLVFGKKPQIKQNTPSSKSSINSVVLNEVKDKKENLMPLFPATSGLNEKASFIKMHLIKYYNNIINESQELLAQEELIASNYFSKKTIFSKSFIVNNQQLINELRSKKHPIYEVLNGDDKKHFFSSISRMKDELYNHNYIIYNERINIEAILKKYDNNVAASLISVFQTSLDPKITYKVIKSNFDGNFMEEVLTCLSFLGRKYGVEDSSILVRSRSDYRNNRYSNNGLKISGTDTVLKELPKAYNALYREIEVEKFDPRWINLLLIDLLVIFDNYALNFISNHKRLDKKSIIDNFILSIRKETGFDESLRDSRSQERLYIKGEDTSSFQRKISSLSFDYLSLLLEYLVLIGFPFCSSFSKLALGEISSPIYCPNPALKEISNMLVSEYLNIDQEEIAKRLNVLYISLGKHPVIGEFSPFLGLEYPDIELFSSVK